MYPPQETVLARPQRQWAKCLRAEMEEPVNPNKLLYLLVDYLGDLL